MEGGRSGISTIIDEDGERSRGIRQNSVGPWFSPSKKVSQSRVSVRSEEMRETVIQLFQREQSRFSRGTLRLRCKVNRLQSIRVGQRRGREKVTSGADGVHWWFGTSLVDIVTPQSTQRTRLAFLSDLEESGWSAESRLGLPVEEVVCLAVECSEMKQEGQV
jgi:hypothetical protein